MPGMPQMDGAQMGMAGGGAIGEYLGALIGEAIAAGDMEHARALAWDISRKYGDMPLPTILKMYPELQGDTDFANVRADERYTGIEDQVLNSLMERSRGGMTPEDEANLTRARLEAEGNASAASGMIERSARRRGIRGGAEGVNKQVAAQQGANRLYQGGVQAAGDASSRALSALTAAGGYASSLAGRGLEQRNRVAGARDRIEQFNLGRKDSTQLYNNNIAQQQFDNSMQRTNGEVRGLEMLMDQYGLKGAAARRTARAAGGAGGSAVGAVAGGA